MRRLVTAFITGAFMLSLQACAPKTQDDCGYVQNSYSERISWKGQLPVQLYIHNSVPDEYVGAVKSAIATWNQGAGKTVFVIAGDHYNGTASAQDHVNVISFSSTWDQTALSEQAKTQVYWVGDQIQEADVRVNASSLPSGQSVFNFYWQTSVNNAINVEALVLHELGHVLGLKHKDGVGSVMATYLPNDQNRVALAGVDNADLKCEY